MEFWIFWTFCKSHEILTKIWTDHEKVIEFLSHNYRVLLDDGNRIIIPQGNYKYRRNKKSWKSHGIWQMNSQFSWISAATRQLSKFISTCICIRTSWNFVIQSWKSHGILSQEFHGNPVIDGKWMRLVRRSHDYICLHLMFSAHSVKNTNHTRHFQVSTVLKSARYVTFN